MLRTFYRIMRAPIIGLILSIVVCILILLCLKENPAILWDAAKNTFFTSFGLGYTLFYATPLIFTGLSVALSYQCGLFNIGAEGQLYMGAIAVVFMGTLGGALPPALAIPLGIVGAIFAGGLWGGLAGFLKAKRGSHEVIVTILLNFIAYAIVDYCILYPLKNPEIQGPETVSVPSSFYIPSLTEFFRPLGLELFKTTPVNATLLIAILACVVCHLFLFETTYGYEMRAVGHNERAARFAGISITANTCLALFLSGGLAGMVGVNEIMGYQHRLLEGFSPQYGFTGIAVALLARNNPLGIILSAILFGSLHNMSRELEFSSEKLTKELSLVLEGTLIAFIASHYLIEKALNWIRKKVGVA